MSAPPDPQDLLLAGPGLHWAADGAEQCPAGAPLRDGDGAQQREQLGFGSAREHPPVAMATASPGKKARGYSTKRGPLWQQHLSGCLIPDASSGCFLFFLPAWLLGNLANELVSACRGTENNQGLRPLQIVIFC